MECISPVGDVLGLSDCMACAGCVEVDEKAGYKEGIPLLGQKGVGVVICTQAKVALYERLGRKDSFRSFESALAAWLCNSVVIDSSFGERIVSQHEIENVLLSRASSSSRQSDSGSNKRTVLSGQCPGVVEYIEQSAHHLVNCVSSALTGVEVCAVYLRKQGCSKVVSIVMCKDKRLEAEKAASFVDYALTANDIYGIIREKGGLDVEQGTLVSEKSKQVGPKEISEESTAPETAAKLHNAFPLLGSTSGGIFERIEMACSESSMWKVVGKTQKENRTEVTLRHKESGGEKGDEKVLLQIHSLPYLITFATKSKSKEYLEKHLYVELMLCKGGCLNGPSQGIYPSVSIFAQLQKDSFCRGCETEKSAESGSRDNKGIIHKTSNRSTYNTGSTYHVHTSLCMQIHTLLSGMRSVLGDTILTNRKYTAKIKNKKTFAVRW